MPQLPQISTVRTAGSSTPKMSRPSRFPSLNMPLIVVAAALTCYGLLVVYSAVSTDADYSFSRQLMGVAVGLVAMVALWKFDYRRLGDMVKILMIVNVVLILSPHLPIIGVNTMGATSWIKIGIQIQPGEFAKITVILMDAAIMARYNGHLNDLREYLKAVGLMLVPFFCIMTQPDLGTGLVYIFIAAVALVVGGARPEVPACHLGRGHCAHCACFRCRPGDL